MVWWVVGRKDLNEHTLPCMGFVSAVLGVVTRKDLNEPHTAGVTPVSETVVILTRLVCSNYSFSKF